MKGCLKKRVRSIVTSNYYLNRYWTEHKYNSNKKVFREAIQLYDDVLKQNDDDAIKAIKAFSKVFQKHKTSMEYRLDQNDFYGHANMILSYAGLSDCFDSYDMPTIEHGLHLTGMEDTNYSPARCSIMTFGDFRKKTLQQYIKNPVFCIGPLIHYVKAKYNMENFQKRKTRLGKNLLVIPMHFFEGYQGYFDMKAFIAKINQQGKMFDSITICLYWFDAINQSVLEQFQAEGYNLVSAGYRLDQNFLSRLRSLIELSDEVLTNSVGSHIGYCRYLNKPISCYNQEAKITYFVEKTTHDYVFEQNIQKIAHAFENKNYYSEQEEVYNYFWGANELKTADEIAMILRLNQEIIHHAHGFYGQYHLVIQKMLGELSNGNEQEKKMGQLLHNALPSN